MTKASNSETKESQKLLKEMKKTEPEQLGKCQYFLADKGYDGAPLTEWLEGNEINPIIDIRNCWKEKEETHQYKDSSLVYNYEGKVWYVDRDYKFEKHTIRGLEKMKMFINVTFIVYLAMAKAKIERGEKEHLTRLYA